MENPEQAAPQVASPTVRRIMGLDVGNRCTGVAGRSGNRRDGIDRVAAVLILQSFLDSQP